MPSAKKARSGFKQSCHHSWCSITYTWIRHETTKYMQVEQWNKYKWYVHIHIHGLYRQSLIYYIISHFHQPAKTCSGDIVFFVCLPQISLASDDTRWMNSVQQFRISSLASLAMRTLGTSSLIILFRAARGMFNSSSSMRSAISDWLQSYCLC